MSIKMKELVNEIKNEDYPAKLDTYIGKKVDGKTVDGWKAEHYPRLGVVYWSNQKRGKDSWTITASAGFDYPDPPIQFIFEISDENDNFATKNYPYKPSSFEKDFKLYMKYLKNIIKEYNKRMKLA